MTTTSFPNQSEPVSIEAYHPDVYNHLNVFSASKALLPEFIQYLPCLGNVLIRNKLHNHFGISLLHKHFDLFDDEILLRSIDSDHNCAYMEPNKHSGSAIPYLWKPVRSPQGQWRFFPLEYLQPRDNVSVQRPDLTVLFPFLVELADTLEALNVLDLFSIAEANIASIQLAPDEILVETTDSEKRRLDLKPAHKTDINLDEVTETFWMFNASAHATEEPAEAPAEAPTEQPAQKPKKKKALNVCTGQHCAGHCKAHCKAHCKSHCLDHKFSVATKVF